MGNRLSKIYTRTGDSGDTGLSDGSRVSKDHDRIEAIGDIDELNSAIGVLLSFQLWPEINALLQQVQNDCFDLGGELSLPGQELISANHAQKLESTLDVCNAQLPALKEFILPGGTSAAAYCHLCRTICRRAERRVVRLSRSETVSPHIKTYLNRLSDLLFVLARLINKQTGQAETHWKSARMRQTAKDS